MVTAGEGIERLEVPGTGRSVSRIGLGTWSMGGWMWGGRADRPTAEATIEAALDIGVDVIDTAPAYGFGLSEEMVGDVLARRGERDRVLVATKCGLSWDVEGETYRDSSPSTITEEVEDSLRRLRTDRIDLYQVHWPDPSVPIERTAEALRGLVEQGKVLALGVCNYSIEQMDAFRSEAPLASLQARYNLLEPDAEKDLAPYCAEAGIVFMAYSPLARGLLSGKWRPEREPTDEARRKPMFHGEQYERNLEIVRRLDELVSESHGRKVIQLGARWVLDRLPGSMVLWGARKPEHLADVAGVWGWELDERDFSAVEDVLAG